MSHPSPAADLMAAMRRFASTVTVIALRDADGTRNAITATSPTSVSMDPPSMLFCVHRDSSLRAALADGRPFSVNILAANQEEVARLCSSKLRGEERFTAGDWRAEADGVPYLGDAEAAVICTTAQIVPFGTHDIVIGTVDLVHLPEGREPLLYHGGRYAALAPCSAEDCP